MNILVIIISYNTRELTVSCLQSVYKQTVDVTFEVMVVDNASSDDSADAIANEFPQVDLVRLDRNIGFAAANNLAVERCQSEFLLLLNPDTVVLDDAIQKLVRFAEFNPEAGIWGGRTLFGDKTLNPTSCWKRQTLCSVFFNAMGLTSIFRGWRLFDLEAYGSWERDSVREVDIVTGCFLLIRRDLWDQLGGFDESFFMYGEEADLCLRARRFGARPMITPEATIIHYGGASECLRTDKMVRLLASKRLLIQKHWSPWLSPMGVWLLGMSAWTRTIASRVTAIPPSKSPRESLRAWPEIWRRREEWILPAASPKTAAGLEKTGKDTRIYLTFHGLGTRLSYVNMEERDYFMSVDQFERILDDIETWNVDVHLTFDDAFESDIRIALPILLERGLTATFFLPTQKLGAAGHLSQNDVLALHRAGMAIGSHGVHHVRWTELNSAALTDEFTNSRAHLQDLLQARVEHASCPYGAYNRRVLSALRRAGFRRAYTSDGGFSGPNAWLVPRTTVRSIDSPQSLRHRVDDLLDRGFSLGRRIELMVKRWR